MPHHNPFAETEPVLAPAASEHSALTSFAGSKPPGWPDGELVIGTRNNPAGVVTIRLRPPASNPTKHAGEWQTVNARIVGNRVSVVLNGVKTINDAPVRVTGGALDDHESEPGPIMLQGDHGAVTFRHLRIRPIAP